MVSWKVLWQGRQNKNPSYKYHIMVPEKSTWWWQQGMTLQSIPHAFWHKKGNTNDMFPSPCKRKDFVFCFVWPPLWSCMTSWPFLMLLMWCWDEVDCWLYVVLCHPSPFEAKEGDMASMPILLYQLLGASWPAAFFLNNFIPISSGSAICNAPTSNVSWRWQCKMPVLPPHVDFWF